MSGEGDREGSGKGLGMGGFGVIGWGVAKSRWVLDEGQSEPAGFGSASGMAGWVGGSAWMAVRFGLPGCWGCR